MQDRLEHVVGLGAPAQRLAERRRADRHDHELLQVDVVVGVRAAVEDVHHRHRQHVGVDAAEVAVERQLELVGRGLGHGQRHAEDGVGAEPGLVVGAVEVAQHAVDARAARARRARRARRRSRCRRGRPRRARPCRRSGRRRRAARPPRTGRSTRPTARSPGPCAPLSRNTSTSTVGLPRESRTSRPTMCSMMLTATLLLCGVGVERCSPPRCGGGPRHRSGWVTQARTPHRPRRASPVRRWSGAALVELDGVAGRVVQEGLAVGRDGARVAHREARARSSATVASMSATSTAKCWPRSAGGAGLDEVDLLAADVEPRAAEPEVGPVGALGEAELTRRRRRGRRRRRRR